jgi:hypothetical protein
MKRSKMLNKIREVLDYELPPAFVHDDVAKEVLKEIEKQGMLPPFSHEVFHKNWVKTRDQTVSGNEWEKEEDNDDPEFPRSGAV